jgi:hypothetical protein
MTEALRFIAFLGRAASGRPPLGSSALKKYPERRNTAKWLICLDYSVAMTLNLVGAIHCVVNLSCCINGLSLMTPNPYYIFIYKGGVLW